MNNIVTLFEYDAIRFRRGDRDIYDGEKLILTDKTLDELVKLSERNVIKVRWNEIKAKNYVGVVKAGDITIEILPKFLKRCGEDELRSIALKNLLTMLEYTQTWRFMEIDYASLENVNEFFEIFVYLFARNLLSLLKVKQNYEYVRSREELRFVRGRIDFARYTNPARLHIIPCIHYERSMDNLINRTLKYTCHLLLRKSDNAKNRLMLKRIFDILDGVTLTPVTIQEIDRITFSRLNADFKPFIDLCRIILEGSTLTLQASKIETFSLMIPMEKLFEEFIAEVLRKENLHRVFGDNAKLSIQKPIGHFVTEPRKMFRLIPDIVVEAENERYVIDTKYKLLDPEERKLGVSQQDLYQIYVYCNELNAKKALLLYPMELNGRKIEQRLTLRNEIDVFVRTISLGIDLKENWNKFVGEVKNILECLKS